MAGIVVCEARVGDRVVWAWGRVGDQGAGFEEITYTENDGVTPALDVDPPPSLGRCVFALPVGELAVDPP